MRSIRILAVVLSVILGGFGSASGQTADTLVVVVTINPAPLPPLRIITESPLPDGEVGVPYSQTLQATGGDGTFLWTIISGTLPAGLTLNPTTGEISGIPTIADTTELEVESAVAPDSVVDTVGVSPVEVFAVSSTASTSITLELLEVDDGTGSPASYDIRFSTPPLSWGSATPVVEGTCSSPMEGVTIGEFLFCNVEGLEPETAYEFMLVPFRGTMNDDAVFGALSNTVTASTQVQE